MSGAIFTTDSACTGTNINIFGDKADVYLDGGPTHAGAAGLPDGEYYVQVTEPDGSLLGTSVGSFDETPVTVSGGEFAVCYQLTAILIQASDSQPGYDTTSNPGGEYKVWISSVSTFDNDLTKTDNFKVNAEDGDGTPPEATLHVIKFYDANANGINDDSQLITGWKVRIQDGIDFIRYTPVTIVVEPDDYTVTEFMPIESNWISTTANPVGVTLADGDQKTVEFGNLCVGAGGGLTLGFWSNKNGQALIGSGDLQMLRDLNLIQPKSSSPYWQLFDPTTAGQVKTWLLNGTATNMAYMLSVQLAAMELNVYNNKVDSNSLIYAPGTTSANALGFASVNDVMAEANASLLANPYTVAAGAVRTYQEALKNALDRANNNLNFVQSSACAFSFAD
ncbi:MAG TPA: hypothetical protein VFN14_06350 [Candidatus Limnocylindria bacterium]|nr:hypothetical protein [Candidatus Limnocylindria bacterium]